MRKRFNGVRREAAAIRLQKSVKGWLCRKAFVEKKKAACVLQAAARGMAARKSTRALRASRAALVIQVSIPALVTSSSSRWGGGCGEKWGVGAHA